MVSEKERRIQWIEFEVLILVLMEHGLGVLY